MEGTTVTVLSFIQARLQTVLRQQPTPEEWNQARETCLAKYSAFHALNKQIDEDDKKWIEAEIDKYARDNSEQIANAWMQKCVEYIYSAHFLDNFILID